jgi:hypothetical protein
MPDSSLAGQDVSARSRNEFRDCDAERFGRGQTVTRSTFVGRATGRSSGFTPRRDLRGLLAWYIILALTHPERKRDSDALAGERSVF